MDSREESVGFQHLSPIKDPRHVLQAAHNFHELATSRYTGFHHSLGEYGTVFRLDARALRLPKLEQALLYFLIAGHSIRNSSYTLSLLRMERSKVLFPSLHHPGKPLFQSLLDFGHCHSPRPCSKPRGSHRKTSWVRPIFRPIACLKNPVNIECHVDLDPRCFQSICPQQWFAGSSLSARIDFFFESWAAIRRANICMYQPYTSRNVLLIPVYAIS